MDPTPAGYKSRHHHVPSREQFEAAITNSKSNMEAARILGITRETFRRHATAYGLFIPYRNQGGKGISKPKSVPHISLHELLDNQYPEFSMYALQKRLIASKLIEHRCMICGFDEARILDGRRPLRLIKKNDEDGIYLHNLQLVCLNCCFLISGRIPTEVLSTAAVPSLEDVSPFIPDDELEEFMQSLRKRTGNVHEG
jgi:hypothetical protein